MTKVLQNGCIRVHKISYNFVDWEGKRVTKILKDQFVQEIFLSNVCINHIEVLKIIENIDGSSECLDI